MAFRASMNVVPGTGYTGFTPSINQCDVNGVYIANLAYWNATNAAAGAYMTWAADWLYYPRTGDINLEGPGTFYIGLHAQAAGAACTVTSAYLSAMAGGVTSTYWPTQ